MKTRFSTIDICVALSEIQQKVIGLRLVNVYDIDSKTYLFKLSKPDLKMMLLIESGVRIHLSEFDWPKNSIPSGFSMKMRKHLRGRRLVSATQLGSDRIIDLQFGSDEAAFHVFLELYDRGNIALANHEDVVLSLLRYRKTTTLKSGQAIDEENNDVKFAVHEPYPRQSARPVEPMISIEKLKDIFNDSKEGALIKRVLTPHLPYGAACIDHCLSKAGFSGNSKLGKDFILERDIETLHSSLAEAERFVEKAKTGGCKGYIIQKREKKSDGEFLANVEFHPFLFAQHKDLPYKELPSFNQAVDEFFSSLESQKNDMKILQREKAAYKKLDNVRKDHESRLQALRNEQDEDKRKALIIENNLDLVDQAIRVICSAIANQVNWNEIKTLVADAQARGDTVALAIKSLKLETNTMVMSLSEALMDDEDSDFSDSSDDASNAKKPVRNKPVKVDIDLSMTAYANAQNYYNKKRQAAQKEQRTLDASTKAFKSAEKKTKQSLKEAAVISNIQKARKTFWFEKFLWFISSENYLVLGGRDAQQNEILVKKYLKPGDAYVHADLHGATSCIIKNSTGLPIPPKTLNEAGTMAICHSAAWDAKVITSAWWVRHDQVSKTAPSGEYLTTGSFMIRGKKNYLPPSYLIYGFGFLFKVDETCIWKHKGERKVRAVEDELSSIANTTEQMDELDLTSEHDDENDEKTADAAQITEEENQKTTENDAKVDSDEEVEVEDVEKNVSQQSDDEVDASHCSSKLERDKSSENCSNRSESDDNNDELSSEPPVLEYPDTHVKINYSIPDKYQLESLQNEQDDSDGLFYLGDDRPVSLKLPTEQRKDKPRMSAKQKRELKKQQRKQPTSDDGQQLPESTDQISGGKNKKEPQQQPYVRGQKKKLRRKANKDRSDDEDERRKMQEMLQSARPKDKKKNKKVEQSRQAKELALKKAQKNLSKPKLRGSTHGRGTTTVDKDYDSEEERELALKEENLQLTEVNNALDSLTGVPAADDLLLFAIPVCAPYNTMQNYKFKVKLTPGTGKKGKAAKTAISMFQSLRDTTLQEKDHLRSVKDHDLSRNMPGKVKVSAPNLQKLKGKKR